ncbi:MAG: hydrogenase maturation protease [Ferruginibacter sp.]
MDKIKLDDTNVNSILTCVVGIGNPLRGDDGAGAFVCRQLEEKNIAGLSVFISHQLDMGLAEELSTFDRVVFIDASLEESYFSFLPLSIDNKEVQPFSHQVNMGVLAGLCGQLFNSPTAFYVCAIGARSFEIGEGLSASTKEHALAAITQLESWIKEPA